MNQTMNILIITDDAVACKNYASYISTLTDTTLLAITDNIDFALTLTLKCLPDAIILDSKLSSDDAKGVIYLQTLNKASFTHHPYILITTHTSNKQLHDKVRKLGADFILSKHQGDYSEQNSVEFLRLMKDAKNMLEFNYCQNLHFLRRRIYAELDSIGISPKSLGYKYLTDAILMHLQNNKNNIYIELSSSYNKSPVSISHAMQHAIDNAWKNTPKAELQKLYTAPISSSRGIPTHSEFIYYYVTKLKIF